MRGCEVFPGLQGEGLRKTSHILWEGTEKMEPVFLEVHGDWSGVYGYKLEDGKFSSGHEDFFSMIIGKHWKTLPRRIVGPTQGYQGI